MSHRTATAALAAAFIAACSQAHAASAITFVSTIGADAGNCTLTAPCKTLAFAIGVTTAGGELHVLNSGAYGASAVVNKSMTIDGGGNSVIGTPLTVDLIGATVVLRDLVLNGRSVVNNAGINVQHADTVQIERCIVERFVASGIVIFALTAGANVTITDSTIRGNAGAGVFFDGGSNGGTLVVNRSRFLGNGGSGVSGDAGSITIADSLAAGNGTNNGIGVAGFQVAGPVELSLERSTAFANKSGLETFNGNGVDPIVRLSNSTFSANGIGVHNSTQAGKLQSRQNNTVSGNTTNSSGNAPAAISAF